MGCFGSNAHSDCKVEFCFASCNLDVDLQVRFFEFGSFEARVRQARNGRNPRTGDVIAIPEAKVRANEVSLHCEVHLKVLIDKKALGALAETYRLWLSVAGACIQGGHCLQGKNQRDSLSSQGEASCPHARLAKASCASLHERCSAPRCTHTRGASACCRDKEVRYASIQGQEVEHMGPVTP